MSRWVAILRMVWRGGLRVLIRAQTAKLLLNLSPALRIQQAACACCAVPTQRLQHGGIVRMACLRVNDTAPLGLAMRVHRVLRHGA